METQSSGDDNMSTFMKRSHHQPTFYDHDIRFQNRNSEDVHRVALAASYDVHLKIQDSAVRASQLEQLRQNRSWLQQQALQEEERVRIEEDRVREETRLREIENRARQIPEVPPKAPSPPPPTQPDNKPQTLPATVANQPTVPRPPVQQQHVAPISQPATQQLASTTSNSFQAPSQIVTTSAPSLQVATQQPQQQSPVQPVQSGYQNSSQPSHILPGIERYAQIHQDLKKLRAFIGDAGKHNSDFKKKTGEMRRAIRQAVGQLTDVKGANRQPLRKIIDIIKESLTSVPSPGVDPSLVIVSKPEPAEGAIHNGDTLPALFIYLLNQFSKAVVAQFVDEAGVAPKAADPIGVVAVSIFSQPDFLWRGKTLIDILMSKIRVVCPVVFGVRGNEKTEEGRARLGWKKDDGGNWVGEQIHNTRMTGLGAGYAAISLRDFSKARAQNPWPPSHYWQSMASIVSTPPEQASSTQYTVLKAMIENYEQKFLTFYGNAALAALQIALVDFPGQALEANSAVSSLKVLGDKLKKDQGLILQH